MEHELPSAQQILRELSNQFDGQQKKCNSKKGNVYEFEEWPLVSGSKLFFFSVVARSSSNDFD